MEKADGRKRRLIPDPQVCKRYGVTPMTLYRWDHNPGLGFPEPIYINGRKYRDEEKLEGFDRSCAIKSATQSGKKAPARTVPATDAA